jgi:hypothetical protein
MSDDEELTRFAKLLIHHVRDRAIIDCDNLASGEVSGPAGERWQGFVQNAAARDALNALIPDIVDLTVAWLLNTLDNNHLPMAWRREDNSWVAMTDLGQCEMEGWLMGPSGWLESFAEQRVYDPIANRIIPPRQGGDELRNH